METTIENKDIKSLTHEMAQTYMHEEMETGAVFKLAESLGIERGRKQKLAQ